MFISSAFDRRAPGLATETMPTTTRANAVLRRALGSAERWSMVSRNVAKLVDPPRVRRHEIRPLTPEQARQLLDAAVDDRLHGLYVTAVATGLRQGELLGLRWEDVELETRKLSVRHSLARVNGELVLLEPKTARSRSPRWNS